LKLILSLIFAIVASNVFAGANHCGDVQRMRTWANGSDTYGVWVEYKTNPQQCAGGFYLQHDVSNKELVYSTLLAAKMANQRICIQVYSYDSFVN